jgi:apolipoprotein N-acyltransferase
MVTASVTSVQRVSVLRQHLPFLVLALAHSLALFLAFFPVEWWFFAFVSPLPLFAAATRLADTWRRGEARPGLALLSIWAGVIPFWAYTEWWIADVSAAGYPFLVLIQSFWPAGFVWVAARFLRSFDRIGERLGWIALALLWTGVEFFRGELFGNGYAWGLIAYPLIDAPLFAAPARIGGVYFVSFLTCLPAAAVVAAMARRRAGSLVAIVVWFLAHVAGQLLEQRPTPEARTFKVAAIQTNVPQSNKIGWTVEQELEELRHLMEMTDHAAAATPDLIVWPETMMPGLTIEPSAIERLRESEIYFTVDTSGGPRKVFADHFANELAALSARTGAPLLIGEDARVGFEVRILQDGVEFDSAQRFNSVYLIHKGQLSSERYDKARLTPFGETMPYISAVPGLQQKLLDFGARGMKFDLDAGTKRTVFMVPGTSGTFRAATPICFEITVGPYVRSLVFEGGVRRADVLVNLTNDGWFGTFAPARAQHLQIARWRALELATPIVRAANTGISCGIDASGRLKEVGPAGAASPALSEGVVAASVELSSQVTIYARVGDVAGWLCAGLLLPALVAPGLRKRPRG